MVVRLQLGRLKFILRRLLVLIPVIEFLMNCCTRKQYQRYQECVCQSCEVLILIETVHIGLDRPMLLAEGRYWISVYPTLSFRGPPPMSWIWFSRDDTPPLLPNGEYMAAWENTGKLETPAMLWLNKNG